MAVYGTVPYFLTLGDFLGDELGSLEPGKNLVLAFSLELAIEGSDPDLPGPRLR